MEGAGECGSAGGLGHYSAACVLRNTHGKRSGFLNNSGWDAGRVTALGQGMATVFVSGTELSRFRARLAAGVCVCWEQGPDVTSLGVTEACGTSV